MKKLAIVLSLALLIGMLAVTALPIMASALASTDFTPTNCTVTDDANGAKVTFTDMHWGGRCSYNTAVSIKDFKVDLTDVHLSDDQYYGGLMFGFSKDKGSWIGSAQGDAIFFKMMQQDAGETRQTYFGAADLTGINSNQYNVSDMTYVGSDIDFSDLTFSIKQEDDGSFTAKLNDYSVSIPASKVTAALSGVSLDTLYFDIGIPSSAQISTDFVVKSVGKNPINKTIGTSDFTPTNCDTAEDELGAKVTFTDMHWGGRCSYNTQVSLKSFRVNLTDVHLSDSQYYGGLMFGFSKDKGSWISSGEGEAIVFQMLQQDAGETRQTYFGVSDSISICSNQFTVSSQTYIGSDIDFSNLMFWIRQETDGSFTVQLNDYTLSIPAASITGALSNADLDNLYFDIGIPTSAQISTDFVVKSIGAAPVPETSTEPSTEEPTTTEPSTEEPAVFNYPDAIDVDQSAYTLLSGHVLEDGDIVDPIVNPIIAIGEKGADGVPVTFTSHWGCRVLYTKEMVPVDGVRVTLKNVVLSAPGDGSGLMFGFDKAGGWISIADGEGLFFRLRNVEHEGKVKTLFGVLGLPGLWSNQVLGNEVVLGADMDLSTIVFTLVRNADGSWTAAVNGRGINFSNDDLASIFTGDLLKTSLEVGQNSGTEVTTTFDLYSIDTLEQVYDASGDDNGALEAPPALSETVAPYYVEDGDVLNYWNIEGGSVGDLGPNGVPCVIDNMHWGVRFLFAESIPDFNGLKIVFKDLEYDHNSANASWLFGFNTELGNWLDDTGFYIRLMANEKNGTNFPTVDISTVDGLMAGHIGDIFPTTALKHYLISDYLEIRFLDDKEGGKLTLFLNGDSFEMDRALFTNWIDDECYFQFAPGAGAFVTQKASLYEVSNIFAEPEEETEEDTEGGIILHPTEEPETTEPAIEYAAIVRVEINPSFDLYVDAEGNVVDVKPLNKDAESIIDEIRFENLTINEVVNNIIEEAVEAEFLTEDNCDIAITVYTTEEAPFKADAIVSSVEQSVSEKVSRMELSFDIEVKVEVSEEPINPKTGETFAVLPIALLIAAAGAVVLSRKRKMA